MIGPVCTCDLPDCGSCRVGHHALCPRKCKLLAPSVGAYANPAVSSVRRVPRPFAASQFGDQSRASQVMQAHLAWNSDVRFHELLKELGDLHDKKAKDYGSDEDPLANVRASEEWGMAPWVGAMVRLNDKVRRLQTFAKKGSLANESAADSLKDIAVYSLIALILLEETSNQ